MSLPSVTAPTAFNSAVMQAVQGSKLLETESNPPVGIFYDLDHFQSTLNNITESFPTGTLHTMAMKANPVAAILAMARDHGFGIVSIS